MLPGVRVAAVVFDLDGVLIDSERVWDAVRRNHVARSGGRWTDAATGAMQGMSSLEWSRYLRDELGVAQEPEAINEAVVRGMAAAYERELPLLPGAVEAVERLAARFPLALASSSNRPLIDVVLDRMGVTGSFGATVSSEEVARGKPAPDVYLEAARRLGAAPDGCVAVEDSSNGLRSAHAAGMRVVAVPNPHFPPAEDALALAAAVLPDLAALTPEALEALPGPG
jgi:HAD superfamily hydrolase (TIGR01509 family)